MTMLFGQALALSRFASLGNFFTSLYGESDGDFFTVAASHIFQDTAGTTPATNGDPLGRVTGALGNYNALQPVSASRPTFRVAANGDRVAEHDEIDDVLPVTFPDLGSECTVFWVTQSEIWLVEDQTVSGATNPPTTDWIFWGVIDRAFTTSEKIELIKQAERSATGVKYGGTLSRLQAIMLNAVDAAIDTAEDDSDGGAAMRGEGYPDVRAVVAEASAVKIYDGTDPDLPLHQTFDFTGYTVSSVTLLEGVLVVGTGSGVTVLNLAAGESTVTPTHTTASTPAIVNNTVNAVSAYVHPDAPTNETTGLKVPTIPVGTGGGLSVILDDATVTDGADASVCNSVVATAEGVWYDLVASGRYEYFATWADIEVGDGFGDRIATTTAGTNDFDLLVRVSSKAAIADGSVLVFGGSSAAQDAIPGLQFIRPDYSDFTKTLSALITTDFNTGWMLKPLGCFLSDTDDTDLVATDTIADRSVNGNDITVSDAVTKAKMGEADSLVWFTCASDETVTLPTDISSSGCVYWWEEVAGDPHLYLYDLSGGQDYVDGATGTAPTTSITFSGADMTIKAGKKMALARPTNTILTPAKIAQIYEGELPLINGGAATLTGTDNAIDAVTIDRKTGLIQAGASDGRSIFDVLERVQKTTNSVSTTIAAKGGLVLEK